MNAVQKLAKVYERLQHYGLIWQSDISGMTPVVLAVK